MSIVPNILTLDPSFTAFGWAVLSGNKYIAGGCIRTKKEPGLIVNSDHNRLQCIVSELRRIVALYSISAVYYEVPGGSKGFRCAQALASVRGAVLGFCVALGLPHFEVRVLDLRKNLTGDPHADKETILKVVQQKVPTFNNKDMRDDELFAISDAIAVYLGEITKEVCLKKMKSPSKPRIRRSKG